MMPDELHAIVNPDGFDMEEFELYVSDGGLPASGARAMRDEFSVYWWDAEGNQHAELRFVGAPQAVKAWRRLTIGPAAQLGMVKRVLLCDGGDCCCCEWRDGRVCYDGREQSEPKEDDHGPRQRQS